VSEHRALALAALAQLRIRSPISYSWCGATSAPIARGAERAMSPEVAREFLLYQLQQELYANFYCRGFPTPGEPGRERFTALGPATFVESLARANHGRGTSQTGWVLRGESEGQVVVQRDGLSLWVASEQLITGASPESVSLRLPCELRKASPGFYLVLSEAPSTGEDLGRLVRLYWHLTSAAAPKLLEGLTASLNRAGLPFQLKVVNDPDRYDRCDAGVLYVPRPHYDAAAPLIGATYELLAPELRAATPAFTKRLAPGLGLAEDPGDGQSFGMHRASLLARAAVRAHELGCETPQERAAVVSESFGEQGLDLDRPYLSPGSTDRYVLAGQR
jgi:hypothetical protein